ncbi:hypothetical protein SUGI_0143630 [Cryptomeria japonica]|nr:hypothetical protein SUGI_0143630 [Cryptomeria japonica]
MKSFQRRYPKRSGLLSREECMVYAFSRETMVTNWSANSGSADVDDRLEMNFSREQARGKSDWYGEDHLQIPDGDSSKRVQGGLRSFCRLSQNCSIVPSIA